MSKINYLTGFKPTPSPLTNKSYTEQTKDLVLARTRTINFYIEILHKQLLRKKTAEGFIRANQNEVFKNTPLGDIYVRPYANIKSPDKAAYNRDSDTALGLNQFFMGQNPKAEYKGDLKAGIYHDICVIREQAKPFNGAYSFAMINKSTPKGVRILYAHPHDTADRYAILSLAKPAKTIIKIPKMRVENGVLKPTGEMMAHEVDSFTLYYDIYINAQKVATQIVENCAKMEYEIFSHIDTNHGGSFGDEIYKKSGLFNFYLITGYEYEPPESDITSNIYNRFKLTYKLLDCASAYEFDAAGSAKIKLKEIFYPIKKTGFTTQIDGVTKYSFGEYLGLKKGVYYKPAKRDYTALLGQKELFKDGDMCAQPCYYLKNDRPIMSSWEWFNRYMDFYLLDIQEKGHIPSWVFPAAAVVAMVLVVYGGYAIVAGIGAANTAITSAGLAAAISEVGLGVSVVGLGVSVAGFATKNGKISKVGQIIGIVGSVVSLGATAYAELFASSANAAITSSANASAQNGLSFNHFYNPAAPVGSSSGVSAGSFGTAGGVDFSTIMGSNSFNFAVASGAASSNAGILTSAINGFKISSEIYSNFNQLKGLFKKASNAGDDDMLDNNEDLAPKYQRNYSGDLRQYYHLEEADLGTHSGTIMFIDQRLKKSLIVEPMPIYGLFGERMDLRF